MNAQESVVVVLGMGGMGLAVTRRVGPGSTLLLADFDEDRLKTVAETLRGEGHHVIPHVVDVSNEESVRGLAADAAAVGRVMAVVHTAGLSPSQAPVAAILAVDLLGTALVLDAFAEVIAPAGAGVFIASMAGHLAPITPDLENLLATTPTAELLALPQLAAAVLTDPGYAYGIAKRGNQLRVQAAARTWGARGARVNTISPGIIFTPLARDELTGPRGEGYRRMLDLSPAGRGGTPDEVAGIAGLLMGPDGAFITGSDILMDGGVTASYFYGELRP
jgi:NAD(P)-dependent dehydrogenase (short-subunit alcohol dehydrogenase family)